MLARTEEACLSNNSGWGVPDWRIKDAYSDDPLETAPIFYYSPAIHKNKSQVEVLRRCLWRWEFLRRSIQYRNDWDQRPAKDVLRASEKYGLMFCFPDPREGRPHPLWFENLLGAVSDKVPLYRIGFDLSAPLAPQIALAEAQLKDARKFLVQNAWITNGSRMVRLPSEKKWKNFLRVIDARDAGATYGEIGKVLLRVKDYNEAGSRAKKLHMTAKRFQRTLTGITN